MNDTSDDLKKTTATLYCNDKFLGTGVIFVLNNSLYVLTAGHNLFGLEFTICSPKLNEISIKDYKDRKHLIKEIKGDINFARKYDVILIELTNHNIFTDLINLKFCSIPKNPQHFLICRGSYSGEYPRKSCDPVNFKDITYDEMYRDVESQFLADIDKKRLENHRDDHGSEWLKGMSGSGLFYQNQEEIICAGILLEIPNKGDDGKLLFSNINIVEKLGVKLNIIPSESFDFDKRNNSLSTIHMLDSITEKTIMEWENDVTNQAYVKDINRKIKVIYKPSRIKTQKVRLINNLLLGKAFELKLKKYKHIYTYYNKAYRIYHQTEDKEFYVSSKKEAKDKLDKITESYEKYLLNDLNDKIKHSDVKILTHYGISFWISICSLNFIEDEQ